MSERRIRFDRSPVGFKRLAGKPTLRTLLIDASEGLMLIAIHFRWGLSTALTVSKPSCGTDARCIGLMA